MAKIYPHSSTVICCLSCPAIEHRPADPEFKVWCKEYNRGIDRETFIASLYVGEFPYFCGLEGDDNGRIYPHPVTTKSCSDCPTHKRDGKGEPLKLKCCEFNKPLSTATVFDGEIADFCQLAGVN